MRSRPTRSSTKASAKGRKAAGKVKEAPQNVVPLERRLEILQRECDDYRILFNQVPMMIWFKDDKNKIIRANKPAADSVKMTLETIQGSSVWDLYPEEADGYYADDLEVLSSGQPKLGIIEKYETANGKIWIQTEKVPWKDESGKIKGVIVVVRDISAWMRIKE